MTHLPARREAYPVGPLEPIEAAGEGDGRLRRISWGTIARNRWIILACTAAVCGLSAGLTRYTVPIYEGSSTLRIEKKEPNLPEVFRTDAESRLATEIEELRSRTLAAGVVSDLGLRLTVLEPRLNRRSRVLRYVQVSDSAPAAGYRLVRAGGRRLVLLDEASGARRGDFEVGRRIAFGGFGFSLAPAALDYDEIRFQVEPLTTVASRVAHEISATQPSRDVDIVKVSYRSPDQELAWQVTQALVTRYVDQRQELQTLETRSTIDFLRQQITTISTQLAESERKLETYREHNDVINPQAEASGEVGRMVSMQTQRGVLETERQALSALLAEVDSAARNHRPGGPSPYRRLLAFPTLLSSGAAAGLLQSLTTAEDQRKALLTRRTPRDPDVRALDGRIAEIERELRSLGATYLQGLTHQVQSLDNGMVEFRRQLRGIPERELQFARLERQPKVLEGVYTMLQTRLTEAEVAAAARDQSVRIVDPAIPSTRPVWPKPLVNGVAALVCGLLLGLIAAFTREHLDRAIHTRADVLTASGLPVLALVPRIARKRPQEPTRIATRREVRSSRGSALPAAAGAAEGAHPAGAADTAGTARSEGSGKSDGGTAGLDPTPAPASASDEANRPAVCPATVVNTRPKARMTLSTAGGAVAEAYAILQTNIAFSRSDIPIKTLVVTSPAPGEGKTTTAVNLAITMSERGLRVLLIDADLRRAQVHHVFGIARAPGLSDILRDGVSFEQARRLVRVGGGREFAVLTAGGTVASPAGLLGSAAMPVLLGALKDQFDLIIFDSPPVNIITDGSVLAANADGVVLVTRVGVTDADALSYAAEQLRHVRATVLGVVLNDIDLQREAGYDPSYRYFRGYEYSTTGG